MKAFQKDLNWGLKMACYLLMAYYLGWQMACHWVETMEIVRGCCWVQKMGSRKEIQMVLMKAAS